MRGWAWTKLADFPYVAGHFSWRSPTYPKRAAAYLLAILDESDPGVLERLSSSAEREIDRWPDLKIRFVPDQDYSIQQSPCSTAGIYVQGTKPPSLVVARSPSRGRNNFTILHELCHHQQRSNAEFVGNVLGKVPASEVDALEHKICDEFAAEILIPVKAFDEVTGPVVSNFRASELAALHKRLSASRAAVMVRARSLLPRDSVAILADSDGEVIFHQRNGELYPPARGQRLDRDFIRRAANNVGTEVSGTIAITYRSGKTIGNVSATAVCDFGEYVFVVAHVVELFGQKATWDEKVLHCVCDTTFTAASVTDRCPRCANPLCPSCSTCNECESRVTTVCSTCSLELSTVEIAQGRSVHHECPW